jgi:putative endonuclease
MDRFDTQALGKHAEDEACEFLQAKGFQLLERNYRCYHGEIDLIMRDKHHIVFVEVRSRRSILYGNAFESITRHKMRKLIKTASHFLQMRAYLNKVDSRFDVVAIHPIAGKKQLEWIRDAFTVETRF